MGQKKIKPVKARELTYKQQSFVEYYIECNGNGTEAARKAGYKGNDKVLEVQGSRLLLNAMIKAQIEGKKAELSKKTEVTVSTQQDLHRNLMQFALDKGDLATATRNAELLGKTVGIYTDKLAVSADKGQIPPECDVDNAVEQSRKRVASDVIA